MMHTVLISIMNATDATYSRLVSLDWNCDMALKRTYSHLIAISLFSGILFVR
jgi:hypothetical protein